MQTLLEERAESLVGLDGVDEDGVASSLGLVQNVQKGSSGRLLLVRNVRVPGHRAGSGLEVVQVALVVDATVDEVNLGIVLGRARGWVDVVSSKVAAKLERIGDGEISKVLAAEGDDLSLGNVVSELILAGIGERRQLDASHFRADGGSELRDLDAAGKKVGIGGVGILAVLSVLKGLQRGILLCWVPCGKVVRVLSCV